MKHPIKRLPDGSIDQAYYQARGRQARAEQAGTLARSARDWLIFRLQRLALKCARLRIVRQINPMRDES